MMRREPLKSGLIWKDDKKGAGETDSVVSSLGN